MQKRNFPYELWSATPTPFEEDFSVDVESVERLVEHHIRMGVQGLMLAGTCGEGPWMTAEDIRTLIEVAVQANQNRMRLAVQVTDHSPRRVLNNIELAARAGADLAVMAAPYFMMNATDCRVFEFYQQVIRKSVLPVGIYDLGKNRANFVSVERLPELLEEPNLVLVKDSSSDSERRAVYVRALKDRQGLRVLNGDEFDCVTPLRDGYNGLLLGGTIFNAILAQRVMESVEKKEWETAKREQKAMNEVMLQVYGGEKIECWMSGLKYLLQRMGIFSTVTSHLGYPLYDQYREAIDELISQGTLGIDTPVEI